MANYLSDPVFRAALERTPEEDPQAAIGHWAYQFSNPTVTWEDLAWLREQTDAADRAEGDPARATTRAARSTPALTA